MSLENAEGISVLVVLQRSCNAESSVSLSSVEVLVILVVYTSDYFPGGLAELFVSIPWLQILEISMDSFLSQSFEL